MNHLKLPAHYLELFIGVLKLSSLMDYINKPPKFLGSSELLVYKEDQNEDMKSNRPSNKPAVA